MLEKLCSMLPPQYKLEKMYSDEPEYRLVWEDKNDEILRVSDPKTGTPLFHVVIGTVYFLEDNIKIEYYTRLPRLGQKSECFTNFELFELVDFIKRVKEALFSTANQD